MEGKPIPSAVSFFRTSVVGISIVLFISSLILILSIRPPFVIIDKLQGSHISWPRCLFISTIAALSVYLYFFFIRVTRQPDRES